MATRKLTIRLPEEDLDFARKFAADHGLTMTQLLGRYLRSLQHANVHGLSPDIIRFSGIIPEDNADRADYYAAMEDKHR